MALVKRGKIYHYDFEFQGQPYRGTTHQTDKNKARLIEAKVKSDAAMIAMGLMAKPEKEVPLFRDFILTRFLPHLEQDHASQPRTLKFYTYTAGRLLDFPGFADKRVSNIDGKLVEDYKQWRAAQKKRRGKGPIQVSLINSEIRVLRKALLWAYDQNLIAKRPTLTVIKGEKGRTFILTPEMEKTYLELAPEPLRSAAIFILDWGLRPLELVRLRKSDITDDGVQILASKTENGIRAIPHTARTRAAYDLLCALYARSEWLFPGRNGHLQRESLDKRHLDFLAKHPDKFPKGKFVLYSGRHTFGTNLAESGAQPFEIKGLMGHSSITISQKYIHPTATHLTLAMKRKEQLDQATRGETVGSPQISGQPTTENSEVLSLQDV